MMDSIKPSHPPLRIIMSEAPKFACVSLVDVPNVNLVQNSPPKSKARTIPLMIAKVNLVVQRTCKCSKTDN